MHHYTAAQENNSARNLAFGTGIREEEINLQETEIRAFLYLINRENKYIS